MVLTRSSRCETRSSTRKKSSHGRRAPSPPLKVKSKKPIHRPQVSTAVPAAKIEVKKNMPKPLSIVTRGLKKKRCQESEIEIVKASFLVSPIDNVTVPDECPISNNAPVASQTTHSLEETFFTTAFYEASLSERAQGNPFIKIIAREHDEESSSNISLKNETKMRDKIKPELIDAFHLLAKDSDYFGYLDEDRQLANLSIMPKQIIKVFNEKYDEFRKEALEDAQCRSNRLRPRAEKINYSVLNGSKRKFPLDFRDDISRSGSNISNCGSWKGRPTKKQCRGPRKGTSVDMKTEECNCGKCDNCLRGDDVETDGCEMSESEPQDTKKSIERNTLAVASPIERRRRNCSNKMINWKYCYDNSDKVNKGVKRVKAADNDESQVPLKRAKTYPAEKEKPIMKGAGKFSREGSPAASTLKVPKELKKKPKVDGQGMEMSRESRDINDKPEKTTIKKEVLTAEEKAAMRMKMLAKPAKAPSADSGEHMRKIAKKSAVEKPSSQVTCKQEIDNTPEKKDDEPQTKVVTDPKEILRGHIHKVVTDEAKIKIHGTPLTAELLEINNEQFYRLVVVLQGTDFIVKNAAMKNIRSPNDTISQLYNCTVCHKDEIEEQQETKSQGPSSVPPKPERKEGLKFKSHMETNKLPTIRPKISSLNTTIKQESLPSSYYMDKLQRRNRTKIVPKSQPHIIPRLQPQLAPKPVSKVLPVPQYEVPQARVPPIIFPNHMKSSVVSTAETTTTSISTQSEPIGQTSGRVVVKATCFQRRPRLEALDSGSEDSDNLTLDPDLKDRIISDIAQAGKSIPDSRSLRAALKRMGRRKTDPDIHPITRRMNKKVVRKMYTGNESLPNILKRTMGSGPGGGNNPSSPVRPTQPQTATSTSTTTASPTPPYKPFNSSPTPQKVLLDNRGRYVDPYKHLERLEETPATALTASERLKLQKIDVAKKSNPSGDAKPPTTSSTSTPTKAPGGKKEAESGEESDFELAEASQPVLKSVVCTTSSQTSTTTTTTVHKVSPPSGPVHIKILPKPEASTTVRPAATLTGKPVMPDKSGFRKILPRPEPTTSSANSLVIPAKSPNLTASNADASPEGNSIQRRATTEVEESAKVSATAKQQQSPTTQQQTQQQQEREMLLLKSILRQKSPTSGNETIVVKQDKCETVQGGRSTSTSVTVGSLRVPPASSYVGAAAPVVPQAVKSPAPMRPITIRMTRVKNPSIGGNVANGVVVEVQGKPTEEKSCNLNLN